MIILLFAPSLRTLRSCASALYELLTHYSPRASWAAILFSCFLVTHSVMTELLSGRVVGQSVELAAPHTKHIRVSKVPTVIDRTLLLSSFACLEGVEKLLRMSYPSGERA